MVATPTAPWPIQNPLTDNDRGCGHGLQSRVLDDGWCLRALREHAEEGPGSVADLRYKLAGLDEVIVPVATSCAATAIRDLPGRRASRRCLPAWSGNAPSRLTASASAASAPVEAYADRLDGATLGAWEASAAEGIAPYAVPQEYQLPLRYAPVRGD